MANGSQTIERGRAAFQYWHNQALRYPENYSMSFSQLIDYINAHNPALLDGIGFAIEQANISDSRIQAAFEKVADDGQGRFPAHWIDFFRALTDEAVKIDFVDAVEATAAGTAVDLVKGAQEVGNVTLDTLKTSAVLLPFALVGALLLFAYEKGHHA